MNDTHERFTDPTAFVTVTACARCRHRSKFDSLTCAAFPDGIPDAILGGENLHTLPFPGDHGLRFEPRAE